MLKMVHPNIGLSDDVRKQVSQKLSIILGNQFLLYIKTLKFHWNIEGSDFRPMHAFLEEQYEALLQVVDDVAERIRTLGYMAPGTAQEFIQSSEIQESPGKNPTQKGMIEELLHDHEILIRIIRKEIEVTAKLDDMGTNNFLTDVMERHEKMAWMLRAFLV